VKLPTSNLVLSQYFHHYTQAHGQ